ncbi:MAG: hypothetical protein GY841_23500 [FCB group bacterium]|nr:hypothetical protein [FCB group bacterium]
MKNKIIIVVVILVLVGMVGGHFWMLWCINSSLVQIKDNNLKREIHYNIAAKGTVVIFEEGKKPVEVEYE